MKDEIHEDITVYEVDENYEMTDIYLVEGAE